MKRATQFSLATACLLGGLTTTIHAEITATGGAATEIAPPADCTPHVLQSNTQMFVWEEQQDFTTTADLPINIDGTPGLYAAPTTPPMTGGTLFAGTPVDSHLIHVDVVGGGAWFNGYVDFADEIIAVMVLCDEIDSSDGPLGVAATIYPNCPSTFGRRICDWDPGATERILISADSKRVTLDLFSSNNIDQIRVVTKAGDGGGGGGGDCVTFEAQPAGATWNCCGDSFVDNGVMLETDTYIWPDGTPFNGGEASITSSCCEDSGKGLNLNNINIKVHLEDFYGSPGVRSVEFCYRFCGGNVNLEVNGHREHIYNGFHTMPTNLFAGVGVDMILPPPTFDGGCWTGTVRLVALGSDDCITSLSIGGQELCIDNICAYEPCEDGGGGGDDCVTFDVPPPGAPWPCCGTIFNYDGIDFTTGPFRFFGGALFNGGSAFPVSNCCSEPPSPGLALENINARVDLTDFFGTDGVERITFCYRNCGGNVNLIVNGQWEFAFNRFEDMPAALFAGVGVNLIAPPAVTFGGCEIGMVILEALPGECITDFAVGGQEFCIDDLCVAGPCDATDPCPEDLDGNGMVDVGDLLTILGNWGACPAPCPPSCVGDIDGDCNVGTTDLLAILAAWGPCP